MRYETLPVGPIGTNCYIVFDGKTGLLCIIDPGAEPEKIIDAAEKYRATSKVILFTHAHVDHISAAGPVAGKLAVKRVFLPEADHPLYHSRKNHLLPYIPAAENLPEVSAELPEKMPFTVIPLPGHSPGGCGYYFPEEKVLFCGDSIFAGSIGRTDLPGGNYGELIDSLRNRLLTLPDEVLLLPGHGGSSTVGEEKRNNPYLF